MDAVEEIKGRLSIDDFVGHSIELKRSGSSYKGLCPFHQEKTPSFYVNPSRGTYHCFGCGKGGDVFSYVMETERLSFPEALKRLAQEAGVTLPERESSAPSLKKRLHEVNERAAKFFQQAFQSPQGEKARRYLSKREFAEETAARFELGWAGEGNESLLSHLREQGVDDRTILAAGLVLQDTVGGNLRDRFRGRLIFPIRDANGKVTGFGGRTLGDGQPKYLNSPQTDVFDKSSTLYGIQPARDGIRKNGKAVLVEGYFDVIRAHSSDQTQVVGSLGTSVTPRQLSALSRLTETVVLALDPDPAGLAAAARTALSALAELTASKGRSTGGAGTLDLRVAQLPTGRGDPDELIHQHLDLWIHAVADSIPAFDFYFAQTLGALDRSTDQWRQEAIDRLLPVIQQFAGSAGWQAVWIQKLAQETGINPRALQHSMPSGRPAPSRPRQSARRDHAQSVVQGTTARALASNPETFVERALLSLLLKLLLLPAETLPLLAEVRLESSQHQALAASLRGWQSTGDIDYETFRATLPEDMRDYADELRADPTPLPQDGKTGLTIRLHLARLQHFRLQGQQARATELLSSIGQEDQSAALVSYQALAAERRQVEQTLEFLSRLVPQAAGISGAR